MNAKQYNIGFIGLGLMGKGFTERLVKKGHSVIGYDLDLKKVEEVWNLQLVLYRLSMFHR